MATRSTRLPPPGVDNDSIEEGDFIQGASVEDISIVENDAEDQLNKIFSESSGGQHTIEFKVKIYRLIPNKAESEWLFDCLPSDFPIDEILRDEYGGGNFDLRIFKSIGGAAKKLYKRLNLRIAPPSPLKRTIQSNPQTDQLAQVVGLLQQNQQQMMAFMREMSRSTVPVSQPSMVDMMTGMAALMTSMTGILPKPVSSQDPEKLFDIFTRGIEVGKEVSAEKGETSMMDIMGEMVKGISTAASTRQSAPAVPSAQPAPMYQQLQAPQPVQPPTGDPAMMEKMILKANLANMVKKAAAGSDPGLYVDFIIDNVSEDKLREWAFNPQVMTEFAAIEPGVMTHAVWFAEVLTGIKDYLTNPDSGADNTGHATELHPGHVGHNDT